MNSSHCSGEPGPGNFDGYLRDRSTSAGDADLRALFHAATPPGPSEEDWNAVLDNVRRRLETPSVAVVTVVSRRRRRLALIVAAAATAAAVALALALPALGPNVEPVPAVTEVPFPVTDAEDVQILGVDFADSAALVVGELPPRTPIVWVEPGDVALQSLEATEGNVHMRPDPMIWAPLAGGPPKD